MIFFWTTLYNTLALNTTDHAPRGLPQVLSSMFCRCNEPVVGFEPAKFFSLHGWWTVLFTAGLSTFRERELTLTFVMLSPVRLSSVTFVHPTQQVQIFRNFFTPLASLPFVDLYRNFYGDGPRGPLRRELQAREGWLNIAISDLSKAISRKRCKIGGKLLLITNRKSHMSFQLVPNSVTLNDLKRHTGPYFALFRRIR